MKILILVFAILFPASAFAQLTNATNMYIGTMTRSNKLVWDWNSDWIRGITSIRVFVGPTNWQAESDFNQIAEVSTNLWHGSNSTNLHGWHSLFLRAVNNKVSILVGTNYVTTNLVGDPSDVVVVRFTAGVPSWPKNFQLFQFVQAMAEMELTGRSLEKPPILQPPPPPLPEESPFPEGATFTSRESEGSRKKRLEKAEREYERAMQQLYELRKEEEEAISK